MTSTTVIEGIPAPGNTRRRLALTSPMYPAIFVTAWMISFLSSSSATVQVFPRPMLVALVLVLMIQLFFTVVFRTPHIAAIFTLVVVLTVLGELPAALAVVAILAVALGLAIWSKRPFSRVPFSVLTRGLNGISIVLLVLVIGTALFDGALTPPERLGTQARGPAQPGMPDIYLVLLDGYPRSDTLANDFAYDNEPFLAQMEAMGFDVARKSHSNYNATELTLASMFNMLPVPDLSEVADRPSTAEGQVRALTQAINQSRGIDELRAQGYEIVTVPTAVSSVTMYGADRVVDSGQVTSFELDILREGVLPFILTDLQRSWLIDQHRDRIFATFNDLGTFAAERADHPRFVFAHILGPHAPIAFGPSGEARLAWPCFPTTCSMYDAGQGYGNAVIGPIRDEVQYLNGRVAEVTRQILERSQRPPVIIILSDHGTRYNLKDPDEMLRSFFLASTPGKPGLFPDDVSPINVIPRVLNAYAGTQLPMASEKSFLVDMRTVEVTTGLLTMTPWDPHDK
jgi:hypothetical protein